MSAFDRAWDLVKELSLREAYDIDQDGVPIFDMRLVDLPDAYNEIPPGEERDITDDYMTGFSDLDQEQMDELDPLMKLYYELTREAYGKGYGSVNNYNPFEENYEAPHNDINNFIDLLEFWSGERAFKTPLVRMIGNRKKRHKICLGVGERVLTLTPKNMEAGE